MRLPPDDFLITKDGHEHLSKIAPRTVKEIEDMMKLPSVFDNFELPDLKKVNEKSKSGN